MRRPNKNAAELEQEQLRKYRSYYKPENLDHSGIPTNDYFGKLAAFRVKLVRDHYRAGDVLDVGCGSGDYLFEIGAFVERATGIDFSPEMIAATQTRIRSQAATNLSCKEGN